MIQVYVDDATAKVTQVVDRLPGGVDDGPRISGSVRAQRQLALCLAADVLLFLLPFLPWRRRPTLLHLDLLMLLGFSISLAFFNQANLGLSVPLVYPFMGYLMVRMLLLAFGRGRPREPLRTLVPTRWLGSG